MLRLAVVLFLLVLLPARANLGEGVTECVKRYGKPVTFSEANPRTPFGTLVFSAGPYQMIVFLFSNVEVGARVTKKDKTAFTPAEMKLIMDADAAKPWTSTPSSDPGTLQWTREDKSTVLYDQDKKMLIFTTPQMLEAIRNKPADTSPAPDAASAPPPPRRDIVIAPPAQTQWEPTPSPSATNAAPSDQTPPATP